jgi:predicted nucleic acid-binding protein
MNQLAAEEANARLADFEAWRAASSSPIDVHAADVRLAYAYVRRFELMLRAPDALHLAIARRLDATFATLDRRLAKVGQEIGVVVDAIA